MRNAKLVINDIFLVVAMLAATFVSHPAFGQDLPPGSGQGRELQAEWPSSPTRQEQSAPPQGTPLQAEQPPAVEPDTSCSENEPKGTTPSYTDKDVDAWRRYQAARPAPVTVRETQVIKQFITNGLDPDSVVARFEARFIKPVRIIREGGRLVSLEPVARNAKDRRLNRKLVYDLAVRRGFVTWKATGSAQAPYAALFRKDKTDEIATWIVAECAIDAVTSLQITLRNFIVDEFQPVKEEVTKHRQVLADHDQRLQQLEANVTALQQNTGTPPVAAEPTPNPLLQGSVSTNATTNETTPDISATPEETPAPGAAETPQVPATPKEAVAPSQTAPPEATETPEPPVIVEVAPPPAPPTPQKTPQGLPDEVWWIATAIAVAIAAIFLGRKAARFWARRQGPQWIPPSPTTGNPERVIIIENDDNPPPPQV